MQGEGVLGSQAHDQHPRGRERPTWVKEGDLAPLAPKVSVGDDFADGTAQGLVNGAGGANGALDAFEQIDDDQFIFGGLDATSYYLDFHGGLSPCVCDSLMRVSIPSITCDQREQIVP